MKGVAFILLILVGGCASSDPAFHNHTTIPDAVVWGCRNRAEANLLERGYLVIDRDGTDIYGLPHSGNYLIADTPCGLSMGCHYHNTIWIPYNDGQWEGETVHSLRHEFLHNLGGAAVDDHPEGLEW